MRRAAAPKYLPHDLTLAALGQCNNTKTSLRKMGWAQRGALVQRRSLINKVSQPRLSDAHCDCGKHMPQAAAPTRPPHDLALTVLGKCSNNTSQRDELGLVSVQPSVQPLHLHSNATARSTNTALAAAGDTRRAAGPTRLPHKATLATPGKCTNRHSTLRMMGWMRRGA